LATALTTVTCSGRVKFEYRHGHWFLLFISQLPQFLHATVPYYQRPLPL